MIVQYRHVLVPQILKGPKNNKNLLAVVFLSACITLLAWCESREQTSSWRGLPASGGRAGQIRRCGIEVQFRPDVATCVGMEWKRRSFGESSQVATSAEPPAKKQAVLAANVNRLRRRVSAMDRKTGTVHALGDSLGTVPVLLRKIRYIGGFLIHGPAPQRSWLAMTEGSPARSVLAGLWATPTLVVLLGGELGEASLMCAILLLPLGVICEAKKGLSSRVREQGLSLSWRSKTSFTLHSPACRKTGTDPSPSRTRPLGSVPVLLACTYTSKHVWP